MNHPWPELKWWDSGERQVCEEKLDDLSRSGIRSNPERKSLYKALRATPCGETTVAIIGQDPYPTPVHATGIAFSIPREIPPQQFPSTLKIIFDEYCSDLGYGIPSHGDLSRWTAQGVLLWNAIPSVQSGRPLSNNWDEWRYLTEEVVKRLSDKGIVFALLGGVARSFEGIITSNNKVIVTSHPSPRGQRNSRSPFTGSRLFSTINAKLNEIGLDTIDWELKDVSPSKSDLQNTGMAGGTILPNLTGAELGGLKGKNKRNLYEAPPWDE